MQQKSKHFISENIQMIYFPSPIDHCYILCDTQKEPDRAAYLETWFETNQISKSQYTFCMPTYGTDPLFHTSTPWVFYNPWQEKRPRLANWNSRNLKAGELSLLFNFALVANRAVKEGHSVVMILESDVIFCEEFLDRLKEAMNSLSSLSQWDFLSLSASADLVPMRSPHETQQRWFPPSNPYFHTRCTDSMIFRVSMLEKILKSYFPCAEALDWELNYHLTKHGSKSWWLDPPILRQGSSKEYPSTL